MLDKAQTALQAALFGATWFFCMGARRPTRVYEIADSSGSEADSDTGNSNHSPVLKLRSSSTLYLVALSKSSTVYTLAVANQSTRYQFCMCCDVEWRVLLPAKCSVRCSNRTILTWRDWYKTSIFLRLCSVTIP
jgi:hypothetical protein